MKLYFVNGLRVGEELEFAIPEITVGRELDNLVNIPIEGVSRHHGRLFRDDTGKWFVEDNGSTNGIKCNRVRISGPRELKEGDLIEFGNQMVRVTELAAAPKQIVLTALDEADGAPAEVHIPGAAFPASPTVPDAVSPKPVPTPPPAAAPAQDAAKGKNISATDISEALKNGKLHLFGGGKPGASEDASASAGGKRKTRFSNLLFYTLVICLAVMGIALFYKLTISDQPAKPDRAAERSGAHDTRHFMLYYEKNIISADNVFYFVLHIENGLAKFQIDDLKSSRSFVRDKIPFTEESYDNFHAELEQCGFFAARSPASSSGSPSEQDCRRMVVCDQGRLHEIDVRNNMRPRAFETMERVINIFAENYALRTVSMTPEELREQAALHFNKAEELFQNREARPANLRSAIHRYQLTVEYLDAFVPRPKLWDRARKQLEQAERIRKDRIAALQSEKVRLAKLKEFNAILSILDEIMALSDPDSPDFNEARRNRINIDSFLRKQGGRK